MSQPPPQDPAAGSRPVWRVATPAVVLVSGLLFAVSATDSEGTDLRPGRYRDLASVVQTEARTYESLADRVTALSAEVDALSASVVSEEAAEARDRAEELRAPAGLEPVAGPGVRIVLSDAPAEVVETAVAAGDRDINELVVHQQDIQAVVNAMWRGGASAVTVEGQRIVTTTGIKCEGNAVQLQGIPYPEPYEIAAVGDPVALVEALESDDYVSGYRAAAADPDVSVGWALDLDAELLAPAYDGLLDVRHAEPLA